MLRIFRLFKAMSRLKQSKAVAVAAKKYLVGVNPAMVRLLELVLIVVLIWHYVGCLWWYIGGESNVPEWERVSVLQKVANTSDPVRGKQLEPRGRRATPEQRRSAIEATEPEGGY